MQYLKIWKAKQLWLFVAFMLSLHFSFGQKIDFCNNEGDKFISGYHQTIAKTAKGFVIFGQSTSPNGLTNTLSPLEITPENGFTYQGNPIMATMGSKLYYTHYYLLTTKGLYAWGNGHGPGVASGMNSEFHSVALPAGITPENIRFMTASYGVLGLLTTSGEVYIQGHKPALYGVGTTYRTLDWNKVEKEEGGVLNRVKMLKIHSSGAFVYTEDGDFYTWGQGTFLGSNDQPVLRGKATKMTKPFDNAPSMIAVTGSSGYYGALSYYALDPITQRVFVLGRNYTDDEVVYIGGQLGVGDVEDRLNWDIVKTAAGQELRNVKFVNAQDNSEGYQSAGAITTDGKIHLWGVNEYKMLGQEIEQASVVFATTPTSFKSDSEAIFLEMGGHTTMYIDANIDRFCYIGHRISGSMGNGEDHDTEELIFNCEDTPLIEDLCVLKAADLKLEKTVSNSEPAFGSLVTFTLTVTNLGPDNANDVVVVDKLPDGYTYESDSENGTTYDAAMGVWKLGHLELNEKKELEITVYVNKTGDYLNKAEVFGYEEDPELENNTSEAITTPIEGESWLITNPNIYQRIQ